MKKALILLLAFYAGLTNANDSNTVASESRDASLAFVLTLNMTVNHFGHQCLSLVERSESPLEYRQIWQDKNARFIEAAAIYMNKRMIEAFDLGGEALRDSAMDQLLSVTGSQSMQTIQDWFANGDKETVCAQVIRTIDNGEFDFNDTMPMFQELEDLVAWSESQK